MSAFNEERVLSVHHWTDRLFSFTTTRDASLRFSNGHFTMIGLRKEDGKPLLRAYSIASANYEEHLEFLSIKVPDGPLTSRLQHIQVGDTIIVGRKPTGTLLIDYLLPAKRLYLLSTGTGVAPFLSIIRDPETYERFEQVVLVHGTREVNELAYHDFIEEHLPKHEFLGELLSGKLLYYPTVTREEFRNTGRVTTLLENGKLAADLGLPPLNPAEDRVMICGSPEMLRDLKAMMEASAASTKATRPSRATTSSNGRSSNNRSRPAVPGRRATLAGSPDSATATRSPRDRRPISGAGRRRRPARDALSSLLPVSPSAQHRASARRSPCRCKPFAAGSRGTRSRGCWAWRWRSAARSSRPRRTSTRTSPRPRRATTTCTRPPRTTVPPACWRPPWAAPRRRPPRSSWSRRWPWRPPRRRPSAASPRASRCRTRRARLPRSRSSPPDARVPPVASRRHGRIEPARFALPRPPGARPTRPLAPTTPVPARA